MKLPFINDK